MPDADLLVTIKGKDVSKDIVEWEVTDDDEGSAQIMVTLASPDLKYADSFDYNDDMEIRFGWQNDMSDPAFLPVAEIEPDFGEGKYDSVRVVGRDPTKKLSGGKHRGNYKPDMDIKDALKGEIESYELKADDGGGEGKKLKQTGAMNENSRQLAYRFARMMKAKSGGGGQSPSNPMSKDKASSPPEGTEMERDQGHSWSSAGGLMEEGTEPDENRGHQLNRSHGAEPLTATLNLKGFPKLKAKTVVSVQGYGQKFSGDWYAKTVKHSGKKGQGFRTEAHLIRGGTGEGGAGGEPPMVMHANIYKKDEVYFGPRKMTGSASQKFMRGDGKVIGFKPKLAPQPHRSGGEPKKGKGRTLDIRDALKDKELGPGKEE